jgi:very-short-patch-repair endonuclease
MNNLDIFCENHINIYNNYKFNKLIPFEKSFASHEKSHFWSNKNKLNPRDVYKKVTMKYIFNCNICSHEFEKRLDHIISNNNWCIYCNNKKLCNNKNCIVCYNKSFASHEKSYFWSNKNNINPRNIFKSTNSKYIFNCNICNHEFEQIIYSITNKNCWCSYCANQKLCNNYDCLLCLNKSFQLSNKSKFWSSKNKIQPRNVFISSGKSFIFECNICNHEFKITLNDINHNYWCPYCSNRKLCNNYDCLSCLNKSFQLSEKSKFWSSKNNIQPRNVFKNSSVYILFNCNICNNEFKIQIYNITTSNQWCNCTIHKTETKLYNWLKDKYKELILIKQFKIIDNKFKYDFYIKDLNLIIEIDGLQHFKQVSNWNTPEFTLNNDINKINLLIKNNYSIIHILQDDIWNNKNNWEMNLYKSIKEYYYPTIIIIDNKENLYKTHINELKKYNYEIIML